MNELFHIDRFQVQEGELSASSSLNPMHEIFQGHFPGQPVLPGVCMVRIAQELLEKAIQCPLELLKADQIKFLAVIDPRQTRSFEVKMNYSRPGEESLKAGGFFFNGETVYFKLQGAEFRTVPPHRWLGKGINE